MKHYLKQIKNLRDIPPVLMMFCTRKNRYVPEIEWSYFWTHNIFRVYELIFGRRDGIRPEISVYSEFNEEGLIVKQIIAAFTFEGACAIFEQSVREYLASSWKPKRFKVYIPELVTPQGFRIPASPFLFAIAFDALGQSLWPANGNAASWTAVVTGSNPIITSIGHVEPAGDNTNSGVYNSVAMTKNIAQNGYANNGYMNIWALHNPATGSHTLTMGYSTTSNSGWESISFSGAKQTSTLDSTAGSVGSSSTGSPLTMATTVVLANSALICGVQDLDGGWTASTNTTQKSINAGILLTAISTATVGTGSQALAFTRSGTSRVNGWVVASIAPFVASGPTNLKTYNTNVAANIKTIDTNPIANVKTLNTNG